MSYTITNNSATATYNFSTYSLPPKTSVAIDFLDNEILKVVDSEYDLTITPPYLSYYTNPYPDTFIYSSTLVNIEGLTAYPDLRNSNNALSVSVTIAAKNLDSLKTTVVSMQSVILDLQKQLNSLTQFFRNNTLT